MTTIWVCIAVTALISFLIKAAGPAVLGGRPLPEPARLVVALLAPVVLVALVLTDVAGPRWESLDGTVVAGVGAAGAARLLRAPILAAVLMGVAVTAALRAIT